MPVAAVAGIAVAGAAASAFAKKKAADKAAAIQKGAIAQQQQILQKNLDPATLNRRSSLTV